MDRLFLWLLLLMPTSGFSIDVYMSSMVPWSYITSKADRFDGVNVRILAELSRRTGIRFNYVIVPTARHLIQFRSTKNALSFARDENFTDDVAPVLAEVARHPSIVLLSKNSPVKTYEDLVEYAKIIGVGVLRGLTYRPLSKDERLKKIIINDIPSGLKMLVSGRLVGVVGTQPLILSNIKSLGLEQDVGRQLVVGENIFVIRMKPGSLSETDAKLLQSSVLKMREEKVLDGIFQTYMQEPPPPVVSQ